MLLHQMCIEAKTKILTTTKCAFGHLQRSETPTLQNPLCNLKAIKSLGSSFAWWAHNLLDINRTTHKIARAYRHT